MKRILSEVLVFIKFPNDERIDNWSLKKNIKYLFSIFIFELALNVLVLFPILYFLNKIEPLIVEDQIDYKHNTLLESLIIAGVLVPIIEEFIFRYLLRYNKVFSVFINKGKWNIYFKYLVYLSILFFGFIHSSNYTNESVLFYLFLPIIVATQLIGGVFLTFLRVRFNMLTSILSHILWNVSLTLLPLFIVFFEKPYTKSVEGYSVQIEYVNYNKRDNQIFEIDSLDGKIYSIYIKEYSINHILDSLNGYKRSKEDYLINIKLNSKKGISSKDVESVLLDYAQSELD